jgi:hypothetical protein
MHFTDEDIRFLKDWYDNLMSSFGFNHGSNRFDKAFKSYFEVLNSQAFKETRQVEASLSGLFHQAILDISELSYIMHCLKDADNKELLKQKFKLMNTGHNIHELETGDNKSVARNTQYELLFLAILRRSGIYAVLKEPNPDVFASTKTYNYAIECKRVFSLDPKAVKTAIDLARHQLNEYIHNRHTIGIISLDLSRHLTKSKFMLTEDANNPNSIKLRMIQFLKDKAYEYQSLWQLKDTDSPNILYILLHVSALSIREGVPDYHSATKVVRIGQPDTDETIYKETDIEFMNLIGRSSE